MKQTPGQPHLQSRVRPNRRPPTDRNSPTDFRFRRLALRQDVPRGRSGDRGRQSVQRRQLQPR
jgi:hypothetical protein